MTRPPQDRVGEGAEVWTMTSQTSCSMSTASPSSADAAAGLGGTEERGDVYPQGPLLSAPMGRNPYPQLCIFFCCCCCFLRIPAVFGPQNKSGGGGRCSLAVGLGGGGGDQCSSPGTIDKQLLDPYFSPKETFFSELPLFFLPSLV